MAGSKRDKILQYCIYPQLESDNNSFLSELPTSASLLPVFETLFLILQFSIESLVFSDSLGQKGVFLLAQTKNVGIWPCDVVWVHRIACCLNTMPCGLFCCTTQNSNIRVFVPMLTDSHTFQCYAKANCLYPCRGGPWKLCRLSFQQGCICTQPSKIIINVPFLNSEKAWRYNRTSQLCLAQVMSMNHNHNSVICAWTRVERVMGPLHALFFQLSHFLGCRTAPL